MQFEKSPEHSGTFLAHSQVQNHTVNRPFLILKKIEILTNCVKMVAATQCPPKNN